MTCRYVLSGRIWPSNMLRIRHIPLRIENIFVYLQTEFLIGIFSKCLQVFFAFHSMNAQGYSVSLALVHTPVGASVPSRAVGGSSNWRADLDFSLHVFFEMHIAY